MKAGTSQHRKEQILKVLVHIGLRLDGAHHEIDLPDPRRAAPQKLRTILRQPVR